MGAIAAVLNQRMMNIDTVIDAETAQQRGYIDFGVWVLKSDSRVITAIKEEQRKCHALAKADGPTQQV